jgi:DNA-binding response OmpR family regulator
VLEEFMSRSPRILIVEHDHAMRHGLSLHLELDGCACYAVPNATTAIQRDDLGSFDLVVCGLTAGLFDAQPIIEAVRRASGDAYVAILLLATSATSAAAIVSLEQGADGFLVKPFGFRELVASVRALLRTRPAASVNDRYQTSWSDPGRLYVQGLDVDPARRRVRVEGRDVRLTEQEFQLLYVLAANAGRVLTRGALLTHIWGRTFVSTRSVDALVKRVRRRLEAAAGRPSRIQAIRGVGYRFNAMELYRSA